MSEQLPELFVRRLEQIVAAEDLPTVCASFAATKPLYARINPLLGPLEAALTAEELLSLGAERIVGMETALRFPSESREALTRSTWVTDGRLYVQSLSSQCAAPVLAPLPGEIVLDLAAAPGGKTLHLAALMNNQGKLSAVERVRERMFRLAANLKRGGVSISRTYLMDGRDVGRKTPNRFDRVLLDAPCSSEARLKIGDAESLKYWSLRKIDEQSRKQLGLLVAGLQATKPGGSLLYCTCSMAPEENEAIVAGALDRFEGELEVLPIDSIPAVAMRPGLTTWNSETFPESLALTRRILPTAEVDAFYLALIKRHA